MKASHLIRGRPACGGCVWGHSGEESCAAHHCSTWTVGDGIRRASRRMATRKEDRGDKRGLSLRSR
jgi:hypothetical protein